MIQPRWLTVEEVLRLHEIQIERYGGQPGVRDLGMLESAVFRPRNKHYHDQVEDIVELAVPTPLQSVEITTFMTAISERHSLAMTVFLELHGLLPTCAGRTTRSFGSTEVFDVAVKIAFVHFPFFQFVSLYLQENKISIAVGMGQNLALQSRT